jgi:DNA-binding beta-propeller fold protein YncE
MIKCTKGLAGQWFGCILMLVFLALVPIVQAAPVDKSDLNNDGTVDTLDLEIFSNTYLAQDWQAVDWCLFYETSISDEKYFRSVTSERTASFKELLEFIAGYFNCEGTPESADKSDLNGDSIIDLSDLIIFSTNYLETNWEAVDWCLFHESTLAGADFEGQSTKFYLRHFGLLLEFINEYFNCGGGEPPPTALLLENVPKHLGRITAATDGSGDYYVTDPVLGSLFIYDANLVAAAEIKGLSHPLGVAVDSLGRILIGNDGRDNIEAYDPANGDLLAVFGAGLVKMPNAITLDDLGNIYVIDSLLNNIRVFDSSYNPVKTIGRAGMGQSELSFPVDAEIVAGIGPANAQELFVADQGNYRIQVYDLEGNWLRSITFGGVPGQNCNWFTGVCEIPAVPSFKRVQALETDSFGRLHVLDKGGAAASVFDPADGAYQGSYGTYGTDPGTLTLPMDVLISATNTAIVTAGDGDRIEVFALP